MALALAYWDLVLCGHNYFIHFAAFCAVAVDGAAGLHGVDLKIAVEPADEGRVGVGEHQGARRAGRPRQNTAWSSRCSPSPKSSLA